MRLKRLYLNALVLLFASVFLCSSDSGCGELDSADDYEEVDFEYTLHVSPTSLSIATYGGHYSFKVWMTNKKGDKVKGKIKVWCNQGTNLTFDNGAHFQTYYYFTSSEPVATVGFTIDKNSTVEKRKVSFEIYSTSDNAKSIGIYGTQNVAYI